VSDPKEDVAVLGLGLFINALYEALQGFLKIPLLSHLRRLGLRLSGSKCDKCDSTLRTMKIEDLFPRRMDRLKIEG
jgi:hypothetical protein